MNSTPTPPATRGAGRSPVVRWAPVVITAKHSNIGSAWTATIPGDLIRAMRSNPGKTYQLQTEDGSPLRMSRSEVARLAASCPRPFRVQSRAGSASSVRHVWVSCDPAHDEALRTRRAAK